MKTQKEFRDEHWETLMILYFDENDAELLDDIYDTIYDDLEYVLNLMSIETNMVNIMTMDKGDLTTLEDKAINRYYDVLTKGVASILLFDKEEYYEYSLEIYNMLLDNYILLGMGYNDKNYTQQALTKEFKVIFDKTKIAIKENENFENYR